MNRRDIGSQYETQALHFLQRAGLRLRERNYHCRLGEIDLIMEDNGDIVFVEVRYRRQGGSSESITYHKQCKLSRAALHYLQHHQLFESHACRFDVIAIDGDNLDWLKNAFDCVLPE